MTSKESGEGWEGAGDLPNPRCFEMGDETGVVLLHGFETSFTVNKQKTLTRCVYLE